MLRVVYTSRATGDPHAGDLIELLDAARERNHDLAVTGMLVYARGTFLQQLEGPEQAVEAVMESITADGRHAGIRVLERTDAPERDFPFWSMGFEDSDPEWLAQHLPGYVPVGELGLTAVMDADHARRLLLAAHERQEQQGA